MDGETNGKVFFLFPFSAGTETTMTTLQWAFALMCEYPEVQNKVAEELDQVIGRERLPSIDDRGKMPYTEATLYEIFRFGSVVPFGVPHSTTEDVVLCKFYLENNTWFSSVLPCMYWRIIHGLYHILSRVWSPETDGYHVLFSFLYKLDQSLVF